jgi:hypothetical protein
VIHVTHPRQGASAALLHSRPVLAKPETQAAADDPANVECCTHLQRAAALSVMKPGMHAELAAQQQASKGLAELLPTPASILDTATAFPPSPLVRLPR